MSTIDEGGTLLDLPDVFVGYQKTLMASVAQFKVVVAEKSRRTGYSWVMAAVAVLTAAAMKSARGMNVLYMGYEKDMTREFIGYCGEWAKAIEPAAAEFEESIFKDPENPDKDILTFRMKFGSGFEITALSSAPRSLRGKQGLVIIDEAAFHDDLPQVIKAALAHLMWGGKVVILSTHNGEDNDFNGLVKNIRAGKLPYHLLRTTLDDAIADGIVKRIFMKTGQEWSAEAQADWRADIVKQYAENADEELFCVPSEGTGAYLSFALIWARMKEGIPVIRYEPPASMLMRDEHLRAAMIKEFCETELLPILDRLDKKTPYCFGQDFGRKRDLSVFWPLAIERSMVRTTPFLLEMRNTPYEAQKQILFYIVDRFPIFRAGKLDAGGNGGYLAEVAMQRYGERIEPLMLTEPWYRENMPKWRAAFEDGTIVIPRDDEVMTDHRLVKLIRGVGRVPEERTGEADKRRHGDSAIAGALAIAASLAEPEEYGYEGAPRVMASVEASESGFYMTAAQANAAQERDEDGFMPRFSRRVY